MELWLEQIPEEALNGNWGLGSLLFSLESWVSLNSLAAVEEVACWSIANLYSVLRDAEFCYICTSEMEITISLLSERRMFRQTYKKGHILSLRQLMWRIQRSREKRSLSCQIEMHVISCLYFSLIRPAREKDITLSKILRRYFLLQRGHGTLFASPKDQILKIFLVVFLFFYGSQFPPRKEKI